ncbi:Glycosyl transferase, group 1 domain protein [Rhodopirellula maiorica SM1]|uniref:Glycosyl transferase, group 1 domain protein n=1 Tax=Rhodopirellula maiorica SM1 TaxID=1265738 RepID=M5R7W5_9BACT|nr:glycosyltransferase family 4 protein [Rhodopirellula maiorica]EMI15578.1 Glycosyl transferase, group 1 domain protein [Rhodopirellula maiorica SM1]
MDRQLSRKNLKIAWIGSPSSGGGVGGFCRQLVSGLVASGEEVTLFAQQPEADLLKTIGCEQGDIEVVSRIVSWEWRRWYSSNDTMSFVSSFWKRRRAYRELINDLVTHHSQSPFDVIVQFSQIELFNMKRHLKSLPPLVLFPCVHAAGELRWHRSESKYALQSEKRLRHYLIRANLMHRARLQKSCCQAVHGIIGMSDRFNQLVAQDYGVNSINQAVVFQPFDEPDHSTMQMQVGIQSQKIKLLFVGRVSVRKGIEMLVELSHRLDDLHHQLEIEVIGSGSLWSDYTKHLKELNPRVAHFSGSLQNTEVKSRMSQAHALLVPSHYEPGGIVVAEALSHGCAVIVSDEVGSAEPLSGPACHKFPAGDLSAFENEVRKFVKDAIEDPSSIRHNASELAKSCFSPEATIDRLRMALRQAAEQKPISTASERTTKLVSKVS